MSSFELHIGRDWLLMSQLDNFLFQWLPSHFYSIAPRTVKLNAVFIIHSSSLNKCLLMSGKVFPSLVLIVASMAATILAATSALGGLNEPSFQPRLLIVLSSCTQLRSRHIFMTHSKKKNIAEICHKTKKKQIQNRFENRLLMLRGFF